MAKRHITKLEFIQAEPCRSKIRIWFADQFIYLACLVMGCYEINYSTRMETTEEK